VFVSNPQHYLALIEENPDALDQAVALPGWDLPEVFQHLRHRAAVAGRAAVLGPEVDHRPGDGTFSGI
jgi:hypothetical protein